MKHIVMYSGGIGSWAAAKRVIEQHGKENVILLFTDTQIEDEDLYRFLTETFRVFGCKLEWIEDGRDPWEVFKDVKWIGNSRIAQCSHLLKQKVSRKWIEERYKPEEVTLYVGIDWTEIHRLESIEKNWLPYTIKAPMTEAPYQDKHEMFRMLKDAGIKKPRLYDMGFSHNNCGGFCVRGGQGHFINLLKQKRELYLYNEQKEQEMRNYLGRTDISILTRIVDGVEETLTLKMLREEWESGVGNQIDLFDLGGCGCFAQYDGQLDLKSNPSSPTELPSVAAEPYNDLIIIKELITMKWTSTNFSNPNKLQNYDRVVQSVKDCRQAYSSMSDREFASWYEQHQRVPERRTMAILAVLKGPEGDGAA